MKTNNMDKPELASVWQMGSGVSRPQQPLNDPAQAWLNWNSNRTKCWVDFFPPTFVEFVFIGFVYPFRFCVPREGNPVH